MLTINIAMVVGLMGRIYYFELQEFNRRFYAFRVGILAASAGAALLHSAGSADAGNGGDTVLGCYKAYDHVLLKQLFLKGLA